MGSIIIREATMHDIISIQNIHRDCDGPWNNLDECTAWVGKRIQRGFYIQIAEIGGKIVGHGEWIVSHEPEEKFFYLGLLQIDDDYQKQGIGRQMLADGIHIAKELGCSKVVTIPDTDTGAEEFYRKCGFTEGRKIKGVVLPVKDYGYSQKYTSIDNAPFSVIYEKAFVFGTSQASSRHMWEVHNQRPDTDDRNIATLLSDKGDCIQLGWFCGNDTALVLLWTNHPSHAMVRDILTFGYNLGLEKINFLFFDEYEIIFEKINAEKEIVDTEIYMVI